MQLTEMVERINQQLATISTMQETAEAAQQATARALAELTQATDILSQGLDQRLKECEGNVELMKAELKKARDQEQESRDRHFRLLDPK